MTTDGIDKREPKLESIISYLLIIGVITSVILEIIGLVLYFGAYGNLQVSQAPNVYINGENFFAFIVERLQNLFVSENALLFLTLGIIILILTPYARAVASLVFFAWEGNRKYVLITLFVLVVLTISLILH
jgi:uncharacterized membrane protein